MQLHTYVCMYYMHVCIYVCVHVCTYAGESSTVYVISKGHSTAACAAIVCMCALCMHAERDLLKQLRTFSNKLPLLAIRIYYIYVITSLHACIAICMCVYSYVLATE